jgi:hypothetical protein
LKTEGTAHVAAAIIAILSVPFTAVGAHAGTDDQVPGVIVTAPTDDFVGLGGVHLRTVGSTALTSDEFLGVADLGVATDRIESNFTVPRFVTNGNTGAQGGDCRGNFAVGTLALPKTNDLRLTWDRASQRLVARFANAGLDCIATFSHVAQELATANGWTLAQAQHALDGVNAIMMEVDARQPGSSVSLSGAVIDDVVPLGTFSPAAGAVRRWLVTGYDFDAAGGFSLSGSMTLGGTFGACTDTCGVKIVFGHVWPPNEPPVVSVAAADVWDVEGATLGATGAFADPDEDALTITWSGPGTLIDDGNGTWSWTLQTDDDGSGTVVVTADDGNGEQVSDSFTWTSMNGPPTIVALDPSATTVLLGADVTWTAQATDPGSADQLTWSFDGGAGGGAGAVTDWVARYDICGTHALAATVTDDDGGSATAVSAAQVTAIGASLVDPASVEGLSIGRGGRTLPIKVHVGCDDTNMGGLSPEVWVGGVLAGRMLEQDDFYRFNLRIDGPGVVRIAPFGVGGGAITIPVRAR